MLSIFKRTVEINIKIEKYLDTIANSLSLLEKAIKCYIECSEADFLDTYERICILETKGDELETEIKVSLYKYMLLPDTRADVLSLIKSMDNIIDATELIVKKFYIQKPHFDDTYHKDTLELTRMSVKSAEALLHATRAFFNDAHMVNAHINNVNFYEHEADLIQDRLSSAIFNDNLIDRLSERMQLNSFVNDLASLSDEAENIGSKLAIFTIKREI